MFVNDFTSSFQETCEIFNKHASEQQQQQQAMTTANQPTTTNTRQGANKTSSTPGKAETPPRAQRRQMPEAADQTLHWDPWHPHGPLVVLTKLVREREREIYIYIYIYRERYIYILYIYIEREREREGWLRDVWLTRGREHHVIVIVPNVLLHHYTHPRWYPGVGTLHKIERESE